MSPTVLTIMMVPPLTETTMAASLVTVAATVTATVTGRAKVTTPATLAVTGMATAEAAMAAVTNHSHP